MTVENDVAPAPAAPAGNPVLVAVPTFLVGSITLGLWLLGFLPLSVSGGLVPAVFFASGIGVFYGGTWAARLGQSAVAGIFIIFGVFWFSFGFMVFGLNNKLLGLTDYSATSTEIQGVQATFLLTWLIVIVVLTLATLRLPLAFTVLFLFVIIVVVLVLLGVLGVATLTMFTLAGIGTFIFVLIGIYIFYDAMNQELGGKPLPMGAALVK
jgi:uncharacterized protein